MSLGNSRIPVLFIYLQKKDFGIRQNPVVWLRLGYLAAAAALALEAATTTLSLFDRNKDGLTLQELQTGMNVWATLTGGDKATTDFAVNMTFLWMDT